MKSRAAIGRHPLHPALVTVPIGAFTVAAVADLVFLAQRNPAWFGFARWAILIGLVGVVPAALTGLIDYFGVRMSRAAARLATVHLALNVGGALLYAASLGLRWNGDALVNGRWRLAIGIALATYVALAASGWIGGKLVFEHKVGVVENADPESTEIGRREAA
jgi:uncharacterized membrane protein